MKLIAVADDGKGYPVKIDTDGHLQIDVQSVAAGSTLIGRVDAQDGDKIWSYYDVYTEAVEAYDVAAGGGYKDFTVVPSGEIWVVTTFTIAPVQANANNIRHTIYDGTNRHDMKISVSWTPPETLAFEGTLYLKEGYQLRMKWVGAASGDDFLGWAHGYKMQI